MSNEDSRDYDVGYGKPPKHTRFQPGRSGNPKGRPRKTRDAETLLNRELDKEVRIKENGKARTIPMRDVFLKSLVNAAARGEKEPRRMVFAFVMSQKDTEEFTADAADQQALEEFLKRANEMEG